MHLARVGQLYNPSVRSWTEGNQYNFRGGAHELLLFLEDPSRHEIDAVRKGPCEFALYVEPPLISLCYQFADARGHGLPWSDANYSFHQVREKLPDEAQLPIGWEEGSPETRALLDVILIDAASGIVRAQRAVTWSPEFTRAIHRAIREQAHRPWDAAEYARAQRELYQHYPTSAALLAACQYRTKGGA